MRRSVGWSVTDSGRTRVTRVAGRNLRTRLDIVWSELKAACGPRHDPEHVHRLRVASRRTLAAFKAFGDFVPSKQGGWFEKWLRRIRRAAGETRDLDVLISRVDGEALTAGAGRAKERLLAMLRKRRDVSRQPLRDVREKLQAADWQGRVERIVTSVAAVESEETFAAFARHAIRSPLRRFFARADRKLEDADEIHQLRIEGKKLRYALENFAVVFPASIRSAGLRALAEMQESLGAFTDHASAADRFRRWSREVGVGPDRKTLITLRKLEDAEAEKARKAFVKWWTPSRRRTLCQSFARTLKRRSA